MDAIVYWAILGLVCAVSAMVLTRDLGRGVVVNVGLGLAGAMFGGLMFNVVMSSPKLGYSVSDMIAAILVSTVILVGYHGLAGRRPI